MDILGTIILPTSYCVGRGTETKRWIPTVYEWRLVRHWPKLLCILVKMTCGHGDGSKLLVSVKEKGPEGRSRNNCSYESLCKSPNTGVLIWHKVGNLKKKSLLVWALPISQGIRKTLPGKFKGSRIWPKTPIKGGKKMTETDRLLCEYK